MELTLSIYVPDLYVLFISRIWEVIFWLLAIVVNFKSKFYTGC